MCAVAVRQSGVLRAIYSQSAKRVSPVVVASVSGG
jgi:hypothetical protein